MSAINPATNLGPKLKNRLRHIRFQVIVTQAHAVHNAKRLGHLPQKSTSFFLGNPERIGGGFFCWVWGGMVGGNS